LERYRAALEAGTDPVMIASWTAEVQARKAQALVTTRLSSGTKRLSEQEIEAVARPWEVSGPCSRTPTLTTKRLCTASST
jgi:hypothetical protein